MARWVLIDKRDGRNLAEEPWGRLPRLVNRALDMGRAFKDPETGVVRLSPVSYTHLDVYKRQCHG